MLFGCLLISNIPVYAFGIAVLAFAITIAWSDYKDEQHAKKLQRVRYAEHRRNAMRMIAQSRKARMLAFHVKH